MSTPSVGHSNDDNHNHNNNNNPNSHVSNVAIESLSDSLSEYPDSDTFRILIVTDTHLGHLERDEIRRYDSFRALDEALSIGKQYNVDFVLHAGDLFDKNQPSRFCMVKTLQILKKHCLGNKPIHFEILSDQTQNFPSTGCVNYEDPNYNISLPIFILHGNHDDPAGLGNHAALEQLSANNLVNYIGRVDDLENILIFPILMKKGSTKLALYPLGYIRDERLHRAFLHHKVKWIKPANNKNDWFNIAMLHQNRTRHTQQYKDCIPEEFLPKFLDVVYWGHEHQCKIDLNESLTGNFFVTQPGSTIITSLNESEAKPKYCGIMEIKGDECRLIPFKLATIRPFIFDDLVLDDHFETDVDIQDIDDFLTDKVNLLISRANDEYPDPSQLNDEHLSFITNYTEIVNDSNGDPSRLPLIRLRVDYTNFPKIRSAQFGTNFIGKVANVDDILLFHKKSGKKMNDEKDENGGERQMRGGNLFNLSTGIQQTHKIEDIVTNNITNESADPLTIFAELDLLKSITEFVEKEDNHSIEEYCDNRLDELAQKLIETKCLGDTDDINKQSAFYTDNRRKILRQQRAFQLLQKEEEENQIDDEKKENMDIDEVKNIVLNRNNDNNKNKNNKNNKKDDDELILPKKKKANLGSFGFGNASQNARKNIIDSQQNDDIDLDIDMENDDDLDLNGLDELIPTPKSIKIDIEPQRKKRKLNVYDNDDNDDKGNDVIDSLLGFDDNDDFDDDEEAENDYNDMNMNRNKNKNKNNNHNKSDRVLRSQKRRNQMMDNKDNIKIQSGTLDSFVVSSISSQSQRRRTQNTQNRNDDDDDEDNKDKVKNEKMEMDDNEDDDERNTETQNTKNNGRRRRQKKSGKSKGGGWGSLLSKRANR